MPADPMDVPLVWPELPIDELFRRLTAAEPRSRSDLRGSSNLAGGSGGQMGHFLEIGAWFLKTGLDRRFDKLDGTARAEFDREKLRRRLRIYPEDRLWFMSRGDDGAFWACSLSPRLQTLRQELNRNDRDEPWTLFIDALAWTLRILARHDLVLDCNPNNFGIDQGRLVYIDDDVLPNCGHIALATQALLRLREYPQAPFARRRAFVDAFCRLLRGYERKQLGLWGVIDDLDTPSLWPPEPELRADLTELLQHLRYTRERRKPRSGGSRRP